jgi:glycine cleavage system H protein
MLAERRATCHNRRAIGCTFSGRDADQELSTHRMTIDPRDTIYYKRARFTTRLPTTLWYAPSHCWLREMDPGCYRVGLTRFATRMLGDFVECEFTVSAGDPIRVGETIGWIEGFKAVSDVFAVVSGQWLEWNAELNQNPTLVDRDPYDRGWLYAVRGDRAQNSTDVNGYIAHLDRTIDRIIASQHAQEDSRPC